MGLEERPVFIVGAPRSGTTLMRSIIDAHPNIFCPVWETGLFVHLDRMLNGDLHIVMKEEGERFPLSRADLIAWARQAALDLVRRFGSKTNKSRWAEKTPAHVHHIRLICELFPDAQFIHMIRSGYEVVRSLQNMPWAPRRIRWSIGTWVDSVHAGREAAQALRPSQYTEVRYEDLTREPEQLLRQLCDFLGEPFAPQMLEFHKAEKNTWKADLKPIQKKPVNTYPDLGFWHRLIFSHRAGPLMRELGYSS
jgi:hypothetical protein